MGNVQFTVLSSKRRRDVTTGGEAPAEPSDGRLKEARQEPRPPNLLLRRFWIKQMRDVRVPVHRQPARRARTVPSRRVEGKLRNINHISWISNDNTLAFDGIADLPGHDQ